MSETTDIRYDISRKLRLSQRYLAVDIGSKYGIVLEYEIQDQRQANELRELAKRRAITILYDGPFIEIAEMRIAELKSLSDLAAGQLSNTR